MALSNAERAARFHGLMETIRAQGRTTFLEAARTGDLAPLAETFWFAGIRGPDDMRALSEASTENELEAVGEVTRQRGRDMWFEEAVPFLREHGEAAWDRQPWPEGFHVIWSSWCMSGQHALEKAGKADGIDLSIQKVGDNPDGSGVWTLPTFERTES